MTDDEAIIEEIVSRIEAVPIATQYSISIPQADAEDITKAEKWSHIEGVLYRRGCERVRFEHNDTVIFLIHESDGVKIEDVVAALQEELDDITGRKLEKDAGEVWGMF
jgi:hypothetical protein